MDSYYDLLVIGGGIHGVGVAQAGAAAGLSVLLIEQTALAAGTSSRSSKLIHGGLRYLEQGQIRLVRESLHERELLLRLAPGLVRRQPFFLPVYQGTRRRSWQIRLGLAAYKYLAGRVPHAQFRSVPRGEWGDLDGLCTDGLEHVFEYTDAQTDDVALVEAVMTSARELGADLVCPAEFVEGCLQQDGCRSLIRTADQSWTVQSAAVVNAAGPWAQVILTRFTPRQEPIAVEYVQGAHLELPGEVTRGCYYFESPRDQRGIFVLPWKGHTLLGTTETPYSGDPALVHATPAEIEYLLENLHLRFPGRPDQVLDAWAGIRVLPADPDRPAFRRTRETHFEFSRPSPPRLVSVFGGKLTGYRLTAERVLARLSPVLPRRSRKARTCELPLTRPMP